LIAEDGKLVAIRMENGVIALSNRAHDKFTQSVWVRRAGEGDIDDHPPAALADAPEAEQCGKGLCRFAVAGHEAAIISDPRGLRSGCAGAEIAISPLSLRGNCPAPLVIDKAALAQNGATSILFAPAGPEIRTVRASTGERPWTGGSPPPP